MNTPKRHIELDGQPMEIDPSSSEPFLRYIAIPIGGLVLDGLLQLGLDLSDTTENAIHAAVFGAVVALYGWLVRRKVFSGKTTTKILDNK